MKPQVLSQVEGVVSSVVAGRSRAAVHLKPEQGEEIIADMDNAAAHLMGMHAGITVSATLNKRHIVALRRIK